MIGFSAQRSHLSYRKPFDLILRRAENEELSALADDFRTLLLDGQQL